MTRETPRILVCDHRGAGLEARLQALSGARDGGYAFQVTRSLRESLRSIREARPALIVLDPIARGGSTEIQALGRATDDPSGLPVLLVWDRADPHGPEKLAAKLGEQPWDLVPRDAGPEEIQVRLVRLFGMAQMIREMGELRHRAVHDDRTELLRPRAFQARLHEHFSAAQRHKLELALVLMDLDKFGQINKLYDHTVGDRLIELVGEVIRSSLRTEDVAGRLGGDEFAVLLPYTGKLDAVQVVNRLRERIAELSGPIEGADADIPVSTSIGFETYDGTDLDAVETLRRNAERALRKAKREGGDRAIYFRSIGQEEEEA